MPFPLQKPFSQLAYPWLTGWELISSGDLRDYLEFLCQLVLKSISHACLLFVNIWQCFVYFFVNCSVYATNVDWQDMLLPSNMRNMYRFVIRKPPRKRTPERSSLRWKNNFEMDAVDQLASDGFYRCIFGAHENSEFVDWLTNYHFFEGD